MGSANRGDTQGAGTSFRGGRKSLEVVVTPLHGPTQLWEFLDELACCCPAIPLLRDLSSHREIPAPSG